MLAMGVQAQHGGAKALMGVVTSFKEPLGQLSIQQELPRGDVWGRKPHPASGLCLAPLTPFSPPMLGQGGKRAEGAARAWPFQGSPRANPAAPGEIKSPSAPSKALQQGDAPSTSQLHLAPTRQLLTASAGCSKDSWSGFGREGCREAGSEPQALKSCPARSSTGLPSGWHPKAPGEPNPAAGW